MGLFGMSIPEEYGGLGLSMSEEVQAAFVLGQTSPVFRSLVGTNNGIGSQGIVFDTRVACPLHNWTIGLVDGRAQAPDEGCTPRFSVRVDARRVSLDARELEALALDVARPPAGPACRDATCA